MTPETSAVINAARVALVAVLVITVVAARRNAPSFQPPAPVPSNTDQPPGETQPWHLKN